MHNSLLFSCIDCPTRPQGVLAELPADLLQELSLSRSTHLYKKGQSIFYEGHKPFGVYCVTSGKIKLYKYAPEGKEYIVRLASGGDLLGYRAFFTDEPYQASAESIEDATVCFLDKQVFLKVLQQHPAFGIKLLEKMGHDLRCAENKARDLAYKPAQERMVEVLLTLKDAYGIQQDDGSYQLGISLSREELASMIGTTTETAVRLLTWLKEKALVSFNKKHIVLKDPVSLLRLIPDY